MDTDDTSARTPNDPAVSGGELASVLELLTTVTQRADSPRFRQRSRPLHGDVGRLLWDYSMDTVYL